MRRPAMLLVLVTVALVSVFLGSGHLSPAEVAVGFSGGDARLEQIVWGMRVPRTIVALGAGAALGLAGYAMRALTRNPIADPGVLGVSGGAALGVAVVGLWVGRDPRLSVLAAVAGAALATGFLALLTVRRGGADPVRVTLLGFCIAVATLAMVNALSLIDPVSMASLQGWRAGSLELIDTDVAVWALVPGLIGAGLLVANHRSLEALELGDDLAQSLGAAPWATRLGLLAAICGLAGAAVAVAGPLSFVGLVAVTIAARSGSGRVLGSLGRSAVAGAIVLAGADVIGRVLPGPGEIPAGITTAFAGGAVLIGLLVRQGRRPGSSVLRSLKARG